MRFSIGEFKHALILTFSHREKALVVQPNLLRRAFLPLLAGEGWGEGPPSAI
jgi:hypothetical protein